MLSGQFDGPIAVGGEAVDLQESQSTIYNSGRPVEQSDAFVAAWLPGTEGQGVADVLFGEYPFTGKLPYTWPRSMDQIPFDFDNLETTGPGAPCFPLATVSIQKGDSSGLFSPRRYKSLSVASWTG